MHRKKIKKNKNTNSILNIFSNSFFSNNILLNKKH